MIKAVIFDFDGTLMNTLPTIAYYGGCALAEIGKEPIGEDEYKYFVGNGRDLLIHRMLGYYNADTPENFEIVGKKYDQGYEGDSLYKTVIYDGILELVDKLKKQGIRVCILTNKPHNVAVDVIHKVFGKDTFDIYYGQREGVAVKPSPESAWEIARELGFKNEECAFVGDTIVDVTTGKSAGMYAVGVLWGFREREELLEADAIISEPSELIEVIKKVK